MAFFVHKLLSTRLKDLYALVFDKKAWMKEYNARPEIKALVRAASMNYYWANKDTPEFKAKKSEKDKRWRLKHLEYKRQKDREYFQKNKDWLLPKNREYVKGWNRQHWKNMTTEERKAIVKKNAPVNAKRYYRLKESLVHILGQYWCQKCGQHDKRCLQLDHINGGGCYEYSKSPRAKFSSVKKMQLYYIQHPDEARKKLQILCANCNWIKRFTNGENGRFTETIPTIQNTRVIKPLEVVV